MSFSAAMLALAMGLGEKRTRYRSYTGGAALLGRERELEARIVENVAMLLEAQ